MVTLGLPVFHYSFLYLFTFILNRKMYNVFMNYKNYLEFNNAKQKCRDCYVGKVYNCVVPSDGNKVNPKVLICGEAAGSNELEALKPFIGKAGQLSYVSNSLSSRKVAYSHPQSVRRKTPMRFPRILTW